MKRIHQTILIVVVGLLCGYVTAAHGIGAQQGGAPVGEPPVWRTQRPAPYLKFAMTPWPNQPQKGFHWSIDEIRNAHRLLAEAERAGKDVDPNSTLHDFPFWTRTHSMFIYHVPQTPRPGKVAAQHLGYAQLVSIMGGSGSVLAGGELQDATTLVEQGRQIPGELRGSSIRGGKTFHVKSGDALSIPPNTPTEFRADASGGLTYMSMKVNAMIYPWDLIR